jgi:hypothetical protein
LNHLVPIPSARLFPESDIDPYRKLVTEALWAPFKVDNRLTVDVWMIRWPSFSGEGLIWLEISDRHGASLHGSLAGDSVWQTLWNRQRGLYGNRPGFELTEEEAVTAMGAVTLTTCERELEPELAITISNAVKTRIAQTRYGFEQVEWSRGHSLGLDGTIDWWGTWYMEGSTHKGRGPDLERLGAVGDALIDYCRSGAAEDLTALSNAARELSLSRPG